MVSVDQAYMIGHMRNADGASIIKMLYYLRLAKQQNCFSA